MAKKRSETDQKRPKIYVTPSGARYVKADELFESEKVQRIVEEMADLFDDKKGSSASPSEDDA